MVIGVFEHDDVLDWTLDLADSRGFRVIEEAIGSVVDGEDDGLSVAECAAALGAAEVVAALSGNPAEDLPEEVEEWVSGKPDPDDDLRERARAAVELVMDGPVMRELWKDTDTREDWIDALQDLLGRLE